MGESAPDTGRTLVLLPTPRDNELACEVLARNGLHAVACRDVDQVLAALDDGVASILVGEEWLGRGLETPLALHVSQQPQWSDLPILLLARPGADSRQVASAVANLGNVTVLERPIRIALLATAAAAASRARQRQYELRRHLEHVATVRNELAASARAKDEFLATLAHELRNPLAPMRTGLAVLADARTGTQQRQELRTVLARQVDHMVRLVDDLIDVSRLSRGSMELRMEPVDMSVIVHEAIDLSRPLIDLRRHQLSLAVDGGPHVVHADRVRMTQVVSNLLNNAAKYSPPQGAIAVSITSRGDDVVLEVSDRGFGIDPEVLPHVFEMFTQGRDQEHRAQDGLGVGLSLVRHLVELHGGRIAGRSDGRGLGASFEIVLPRSAANTDDARPAGDMQLPPAESGDAALRVLIVDDNVDAGATLGMALGLMGFECRVATSGIEALAQLREQPADVVLLDIGMPGMDGYEVARHLRADASLEGVRLIALTGWGQADDRRRTSEAGFDHHLTKPVEMAELTALLGPRAAGG